jgi:hypothetical protein
MGSAARNMIDSLKYNRNLRRNYQERYARTQKAYAKSPPYHNKVSIVKAFHPDQKKVAALQKRVRIANLFEKGAFAIMTILILILVLWIIEQTWPLY